MIYLKSLIKVSISAALFLVCAVVFAQSNINDENQNSETQGSQRSEAIDTNLEVNPQQMEEINEENDYGLENQDSSDSASFLESDESNY